MLKKVKKYTKKGLASMMVPLLAGGILSNIKVDASEQKAYIYPFQVKASEQKVYIYPFLEQKTEQKTNQPEIKGRMVYQTYSNYDKRDSKIYMFDFKTKENVCLSDKFEGVYNAMNPNFNNNGYEIVFMGLVQNNGTEEWDIFRYNLNTNKLENLTKGKNLREEDPKYSPDGTKIIFKQGHWNESSDKMIYDIAEMDLGSCITRLITNDADEDSQPCYSTDGKAVYYARGAAESSQIYKVDLSEMTPTKVYSENNNYCYYPVVYKDTLYFSKGHSADNKMDEIAKYDLNTNNMVIPNFNNKDFNFSDACPISDRYIILCSTMLEGKGGYDLYIADMVTGETWSMDVYSKDINNDKHQLGVSYYGGE